MCVRYVASRRDRPSALSGTPGAVFAFAVSNPKRVSGRWPPSAPRYGEVGATTMEFTHFVQLIAIGLQARIPMHMTGFPGVGKTEFTKSLEAGFARAGVKCKVFILIGSIREPQDFGGFPVSTPDGVRLLPMAWARDAKRLAEEGYLVIDLSR